jgi:hypothetical protein
VKITHGQFAGWQVGEVPLPYLATLLKNGAGILSDELLAAIEARLAEAGADDPFGGRDDPRAKTLREIIKKASSVMARRHHPDCSLDGPESEAAMCVVNEFREELIKALEETSKC